MGAKSGESPGRVENGDRKQSLTEREFVRRVIITVGIVILFGLLVVVAFKTIDILLLVFAGVLFGLILYGLAGWVAHFTPLPHGWSVVVSILLLLSVAGGIGLIAAPRVSEQFGQLRERLPQAIQRLQERLQQTGWGKYLTQNAPAPADIASGTGKVFSSITNVFSKTVEVIVAILVILFVSIYTALDPDLYLNGFLHLVPKEARPRARQILRNLGRTLRYWLLGQFCSMAIVGLLTGIGLWLLGIPLALLIGILAGILDFVPIVGPVLSAVPALLLAFLSSPAKALYVVLLYLGIHQAEAHLILPLIQQRAVSLPPVITIVTLVLLDRLLGFIGVFLAAPLAATIVLLIKMIYVEDTLGEHPSGSPRKQGAG